MKRSYLLEKYISLNTITAYDNDSDKSSWSIMGIDMREPITIPVIIKREIYET